ncbi:hypothetical protein [Phytoactinopolyspora mesophila]|uniref:ATP/GTP-binding protein n=1 Tax=Phytoactinopolyspora mesophila TaxID=2650750 RepID=A0A7K3M291_9ACTN|nr:hypothetical protein [Phytoactinopolyspora mesophila]NDL57032.1 hypothetical protein [Phytoactinopolyspora mesophila]
MRGLIVALTMASTVAIAHTAHAAEESSTEYGCEDGQYYNGFQCVPEDDEEQETTGCSQNEPTVPDIPCTGPFGPFDPSFDRYVRPVPDDEIGRYAPDGIYGCPGCLHDGIWENYPDGWIYQLHMHIGHNTGTPSPYQLDRVVWLGEPPGLPPVDSAVLAQQILDDMDLEPAEVGIAPRPIDEDPGSMGLVGAPVWMWVVDPSPQTWGPITDSASERGTTVTVTAAVEDAEWDMGDGRRHVCTEPGTPYEARMGVRDSPTCGHRYEQTSGSKPGQAYVVSVTTRWIATWESSTGETGELDVDPLTSTAQIRIGERQLIEQ